MTIDPGLLPLAFLILLLLAACAVPLAAAVFFAAALLLLLNPAPLPDGFYLNYSLALKFNSPALISIPLSALAGELAVAAGITERLLDVADALAGRGRHAAGISGILGCTLFATVSGVGPAAVSAEGKRLIPEMLEAGYSRPFAAGSIAAAAGLSIVIPASIPLTVYAATTGVVTNAVFAASFLPGLLAAGLMLVAVVFFAGPGNRADGSRTSARTKSQLTGALHRSKWAIALPLCLLSGLFSGFFTAPEAAAFASTYAALIGLFVHRSLRPADIRVCLVRAATSASAVLLVVGIGGLFSALLEACGFSERLGDALYLAAGGKAGSIILINLILLVAGCLLDMPAIICLLLPPLLPLAAKCGLPPVHFGAMAVLNIAIGLVTPPQAHNISTAARLAGTSVWQTARGSLPCLAAMLVALAVVSAVPELALWLPSALGWLHPA